MLCHLLLIRMLEGQAKHKMILAAHNMMGLKNNDLRRTYKIHSKTYEKLRKQFSESISGKNHPMYGRVGILNPNYGRSHTEETKKKISEKSKLRDWSYLKGRSLSDDTKKKLSESRQGKGNPHTEESKRKISISNLGKVHSEETKLKISLARTGTKASEETRKKLSQSRLGKTSANKGISASAETKEKISRALRGRKQSLEVIEARAAKLRGSKLSDKARANMSAAMMGKLKGKSKAVVTCPYCNKTGGKPVMMRYHFNNCKFKHDISF